MQFDLAYLDDAWRDHLALFACIGTVATLLALFVTIWQVLRTKKVSEATRKIANETLSASRKQFNRYAAANANRFVHEAKILIEYESWSLASQRLGDLADQAVQISHVAGDGREDWDGWAKELRDWENTFKRVHGGELKYTRTLKRKWDAFAQKLSAKIDHYYGPFTALDGTKE